MQSIWILSGTALSRIFRYCMKRLHDCWMNLIHNKARTRNPIPLPHHRFQGCRNQTNLPGRWLTMKKLYSLLLVQFMLFANQPAIADMVDYWGFTQLHDAVYHQDPGRVDRLLKNGADVNFPMSRKHRAVMKAELPCLRQW